MDSSWQTAGSVGSAIRTQSSELVSQDLSEHRVTYYLLRAQRGDDLGFNPHCVSSVHRCFG